jgi:hypothetical protein
MLAGPGAGRVAGGHARLARRSTRSALPLWTLNVFPYGGFHDDRREDRGLRTRLGHEDRLAYTRHLRRGGRRARAARQRAAAVDAAARLPRARRAAAGPARDGAQPGALRVGVRGHRGRDTGVRCVLAIEPEPDCLLETAAATAAFLERWLFDEGRLDHGARGGAAAPSRRLRRSLPPRRGRRRAARERSPTCGRAASRCRRSRSPRASKCASRRRSTGCSRSPSRATCTRPRCRNGPRALDLADVRRGAPSSRAAGSCAVRTTTCRCSGTSRGRSARRSARSNACCGRSPRGPHPLAAARGRDLHLERARRLRRPGEPVARRICSASSTRSPPGLPWRLTCSVRRRSYLHRSPMIRLRDPSRRATPAATSACSRVPSTASTSQAGEQVALVGRRHRQDHAAAHARRHPAARPRRGRGRRPAPRPAGRSGARSPPRPHIGMVYQTFNLLQPFTALENVLLGALFGRGAGPDAKRRAEALLEQVGLGDRMHHRPSRAVGRAGAARRDLPRADQRSGAGPDGRAARQPGPHDRWAGARPAAADRERSARPW